MGDIELDNEWVTAKAKVRNEHVITPYVRQRLEAVYSQIETGFIYQNMGQADSTSRHRRFIGTLLTTTMVLSSGIVASAFVSPNMAKMLWQVPMVNNVLQLAANQGFSTAGGNAFMRAGDPGLQEVEKAGLVTKTTASSTHNGTRLRISQVAYDGVRLALTLESNGEALGTALQDRIEDITLWYNGKPFQFDSPSLITNSGGTPGSVIIHYSDLEKMYSSGKELPDQFKLKADIQIQGIKESFKFELPVQKIPSKNRVLTPRVEKSNDFTRLVVEKIEMTPMSTMIVTKTHYISPGPTTLGRETYGYGLAMNKVDYAILDDEGHEQQWITGGSGHPGTKIRPGVYKIFVAPFKKTPKFITIKPYFNVTGPEGKPVYDESGNWKRTYLPELEMKIPIGENKPK
ncbi:DUF4179 domain-containing protein [Paenibacillus brasilensis]|uniref:DUF5643 domain-containing protein n=1 Tax=Paenibacillus brasilensis TaxID=128574 RepID=A0ABU0KTF3_9BACL|nr:DUF4179 domain-containing protein [Paenibacillus brasilensis]MDQ0492703.1 hypothetical protein [Paenibacillus brasilensis]